MREQDVIFEAISQLEAALPSTVAVRTRGGDAVGSPPVCILDWNTIRLPTENGHNPFAAVTRDSDGTATGREFHRYYLMEMEVVVRAYDESDRDTWLSDVVDAFLPFEYDPAPFHTDTTEWEVGNASPRSNSVVEPDWYEAGLELSFTFVSRVQQTADPLSSVVDGPNGGVYDDESL